MRSAFEQMASPVVSLTSTFHSYGDCSDPFYPASPRIKQILRNLCRLFKKRSLKLNGGL